MQELQQWISNLLIEWGIIKESVTIWDNLILFSIVLIVAIAIDYICRFIFTDLFKRFASRTKNQWDDLIIERKVIRKIMHLIPALLVYIMLPLTISKSEMPLLFGVLQITCSIYIVAVVIRFINSVLGLILEVSNRKESFRNKPMKGFIQIIQTIVYFIGAIIIISILVGKSPATLIAGLSASAAVLMLVFKDTILGFVAGIQLSANDMMRPGDWITMNKYGADGTVIDVTLHAIKVQNWDKTITTIPPYALISDSFQNWRGMQESGGRRVKRSINIDMNSVKFCSQEMLEKFRKISLLTEYIDSKENELEAYNAAQNIDSSILVNGRRQTNLGVFRFYLTNYLKNNTNVNKELTCMVRQLQPTEKGIPMELYFFANTTEWIPYEGIQADVFDHILAVLPEFDLKVFQEVSGSDIRSISH